MADDLKTYFTEYGASAFDAKKTATFYGDFAVTSAPNFIGCLKGKEEINNAFSEIANYQKKTGLISMTPAKVDAQKLDDLHQLAKVSWNAKFEKTGDKVIEFDITYLLRKEKDKPKILLYISHQDEEEMRKELGLT